MANILTNEQVAAAIYVDDDFPKEELERYARSASSFIKRKTGYNFADDPEIEPLAIECAIQYVRQLHFGAKGYNERYDYTLGINSLIVDLQVIANDKLSIPKE